MFFSASPRPEVLELLADELDEERLLRVEPVLRLVEDDGLGPVDDVGGLLLAADGREAVHEGC